MYVCMYVCMYVHPLKERCMVELLIGSLFTDLHS